MQPVKCPLCGGKTFTLQSEGDFMDVERQSRVIMNCAKQTCDFAIMFNKS